MLFDGDTEDRPVESRAALSLPGWGQDGLRGGACASVCIGDHHKLRAVIMSLPRLPPNHPRCGPLVPGYKPLENQDLSELSRYRLQAHPSNLHANSSSLSSVSSIVVCLACDGGKESYHRRVEWRAIRSSQPNERHQSRTMLADCSVPVLPECTCSALELRPLG